MRTSGLSVGNESLWEIEKTRVAQKTMYIGAEPGEGHSCGKAARAQEDAGCLLSTLVLAHMRLPWGSSGHSSLSIMSATVVDFLQCRCFHINSLFKTHLRLSSAVLLG